MAAAARISSDWPPHVATARIPMDAQDSGPSSNWVVDKSSFNPKKVIRISTLKRGKEETPLTERVKLEKVLGLTVNSNAALDFDPISGSAVYAAGCVVVVYNPRKNKQTHIVNASKKTITTLAISADGKYVTTGECGHQPHVRVWDIQEKCQVAEFLGHKFGVNCVAFSPNLKYVVSIGSQHDMIVNVWDWKNNVKVASNKVSSKVKAVAFSEDGGHFVTVGNRHVKFWYLEYFRSTKYKEPVPLMGRSAILGEQRNNYFCDVACGRGEMAESTFSITKSGLLCEFNTRRLLDKWVELRTSSANCISVGIDYIFIGCADGIVRCFSPYTLQFITTLPRPHYLGVDVAKGLTIAHMGSSPSGAKYPDTVAVKLDENNHKVTCIYNDHSFYMWDIHDIRKVGKSHSFMYHSACIWGVETYPSSDVEQPTLPSNSFVTCSSDDTIRIWNLEPSLGNDTNFKRNVYSSELLKVIYIDDNFTYLCDKDYTPGSGNEKSETTYDSRNGVRCIKIGPNGKQLASGDRAGNIRIHEMPRMDEICKIEAHDAEVLCLEYSKLPSGKRYLASASRDRLIHVFDVDDDYAFIQTLDDHSSSITAVRFVHNSNGQLQMISCGADKSVIFRDAHFNPQLHFNRAHQVVGKTTLYDMEVDANQKYILTACQDRNIRVYSINSGKHCRSFKGSQGEDGTLIKVVFDHSGSFVATSSTDKNLCVYDFTTGECVATMYGHSEIVTGFRFTTDGKYLISISGDGCIFVWRLPADITHAIQVRMVQMKNNVRTKLESSRRKTAESNQQIKMVNSPEFVNGSQNAASAQRIFDPNELDDEGSYRFSVGPLPLWAKKQIVDDPVNTSNQPRGVNVAQPRGRWAQRIDGQGIVVKSLYDRGHVIPYPESTLASESDSQNYSEMSNESHISTKHTSEADFELCPESLNEIKANPSPEITLGMVTMERGSSYGQYQSYYPSDLTYTSAATIDDFYGDHDGDVADDETDSTDTDAQEIIHYPPHEQFPMFTESEFKVCNTNPDDLRETHWKNKKLKAEKPTDIPSAYVQGVRSTDSEDEDEVSSHGGERSVLNMFSMSTESLDRVGQREKFMKNNFESLTGNKDDDMNDDNRLSISGRFLSRSQLPSKENHLSDLSPTEVTSPKKLEVMKQIEETRKKLDTIGWKASLHSSKSINDLTHIPEKDITFKYPAAGNKDKNETMRRASSMTDLSKPKRLLPSPPSNVGTRNYNPDSYGSLRRNPSRNTDARSSNSTRISRSSSLMALNTTDQDDSRLTRPTISSLNKARANGPTSQRLLPKSASSSNVPRSRRSSHHAGSGTSSGEVSPTDGNPKPQYPVRPRSTSVDRSNSMRYLRSDGRVSSSVRSTANAQSLVSSRSTSERDLTKVARDVTERMSSATSVSTANITVTKTSKHEVYLQTNTASAARKAVAVSITDTNEVPNMSDRMLEKSPQELPVKDGLPDREDVFTAKLSKALCEATADDLKLSADNVLQLCKRISMDSDLSDTDRVEMVNILTNAVVQAQQTLRPLQSVPTDIAQFPVPPTRKTSDVAGVENMLHQYSDMLVALVQQRMGNQSGAV